MTICLIFQTLVQKQLQTKTHPIHNLLWGPDQDIFSSFGESPMVTPNNSNPNLFSPSSVGTHTENKNIPTQQDTNDIFNFSQPSNSIINNNNSFGNDFGSKEVASNGSTSEVGQIPPELSDVNKLMKIFQKLMQSERYKEAEACRSHIEKVKEINSKLPQLQQAKAVQDFVSSLQLRESIQSLQSSLCKVEDIQKWENQSRSLTFAQMQRNIEECAGKNQVRYFIKIFFLFTICNGSLLTTFFFFCRHIYFIKNIMLMLLML